MSLTPDWTHAARCREIGLAPFFFDGKGNSDYGAARRVCGACPVRALCLDAAMQAEGDEAKEMRAGMWGGLTPAERARLARQRKTTAPAVQQQLREGVTA